MKSGPVAPVFKNSTNSISIFLGIQADDKVGSEIIIR